MTSNDNTLQGMVTAAPWYLSRTVWATLVTAIVNIANAAGYKINPDYANSLPDILMNIASLAGFAITIYLHMKSKQAITKALNVTLSNKEPSP